MCGEFRRIPTLGMSCARATKRLNLLFGGVKDL